MKLVNLRSLESLRIIPNFTNLAKFPKLTNNKPNHKHFRCGLA